MGIEHSTHDDAPKRPDRTFDVSTAKGRKEMRDNIRNRFNDTPDKKPGRTKQEIAEARRAEKEADKALAQIPDTASDARARFGGPEWSKKEVSTKKLEFDKEKPKTPKERRAEKLALEKDLLGLDADATMADVRAARKEARKAKPESGAAIAERLFGGAKEEREEGVEAPEGNAVTSSEVTPVGEEPSADLVDDIALGSGLAYMSMEDAPTVNKLTPEEAARQRRYYESEADLREIDEMVAMTRAMRESGDEDGTSVEASEVDAINQRAHQLISEREEDSQETDGNSSLDEEDSSEDDGNASIDSRPAPEMDRP